MQLAVLEKLGDVGLFTLEIERLVLYGELGVKNMCFVPSINSLYGE